MRFWDSFWGRASRVFRRNKPVEEKPPFEMVPVRDLPVKLRRKLEKKNGRKFLSHGLVAMPTGFKDSFAELNTSRSRPDSLLRVTGGHSGNAHQRRIQRRAIIRRVLSKSPVA